MEHPYQVMSPLSPEEYTALKVDIEANGVRIPIIVDEEGNIIDGFHRKQICDELRRECPEREIPGLTDAQKREYAWLENLMRRQLTKVQKCEIASKLRQDGWTQERIARALAIRQATVSRWIKKFIQMDKLTQPDKIRGIDGIDYPPSRERQPARRQIERDDTVEDDSTPATPSLRSTFANADAEEVEGMQQQDVETASGIEPERAQSGAEDGGPAATEPSDATFEANGTTPAAELGTSTSSSGALSVSSNENDGELSWLHALKTLADRVQELQAWGGVPLGVRRLPETRSQCLPLIRGMKEVFTKWEEMIEHENGEAAGRERNDDADMGGSRGQSASGAQEQPKHNHKQPKTSKPNNSTQPDLFDSNQMSEPNPDSSVV